MLFIYFYHESTLSSLIRSLFALVCRSLSAFISFSLQVREKSAASLAPSNWRQLPPSASTLAARPTSAFNHRRPKKKSRPSLKSKHSPPLFRPDCCSIGAVLDAQRKGLTFSTLSAIESASLCSSFKLKGEAAL